MSSTLPSDHPINTWQQWHSTGVPFADLDAASLKAGLTDGMASQLAMLTRDDLVEISADPSALLALLDNSGHTLNACRAVFFAQLAASSNESLTELEAWMAKALASHETNLSRIEGLFDSISQAVTTCEASLGSATTDDTALVGGTSASDETTTEVLRGLTKWQRRFTLAGAGLHGDARTDLEQLNADLAEDLAAYNQTLQEVTENSAIYFDDEAALEGVSPEERDRFAREASERGRSGYCIPLESPSRQSVMVDLTRETSRQHVHDVSTSRGADDDQLATIARRIMVNRARIAELLGYSHAADQILDARMARDEKTVRAFLQDLVDRTKPALASQLADLPGTEAQQGIPAAWNWDYLIAQVAKSVADSSPSDGQDHTIDVRDYYELTAVRDHGMLAAATELYGITFDARSDLTAYHDDVEAFEARDTDGSHLGLIYMDWFARNNKRGGAWAQTLRPQAHLTDSSPVLIMNLNVPKPNDGEPVLLSTDHVRTAFHEFGHILHGLLSDVRYPTVSGLSVTRDFVEFPSQVNEVWAQDAALTSRFAKHHKTGELLPEHLANSGDFGDARDLAEIFAAAVLDLEVHSLSSAEAAQVQDLEAFEHKVLEKWGFAELGLVPRYKLRYFAHIFAGGYAAGYYCYPWAEVLDADTAEWLQEQGGLNRRNGDLLRSTVLSRGDAIDPEPAMQKLLGRKPTPGAYLRRYQLNTQDGN